MFVFLIGLFVPWIIQLGPVRMSVYRLVLAIAMLPCLGMWLAGKVGRIRTADVCVLLLGFWCALGLVRLHGMSLALESSGIIFIETVGPYMLARVYVRDADDFYKVVRLLFRLVLGLMPFALIECVTGQNVLNELFSAILPTPSGMMPPRFGLHRVRAVFEHPILFGLFTGNLLCLVYLVLGWQKGGLQRSLRVVVVAATSMMSLSSGPLAALMVQGFFLSWNGLLRAVKSRWKILVILLLVAYAAVELVANRSAPAIFISYLLMDPLSYFFRVLIFHYAIASALRHPWLGVGMGQWERPLWMPESIDNFWLYFAVHHGIPTVVLLLLTCLALLTALALKKGLDERLSDYRTALQGTVIAFCLVGYTVHLWGAAYVLFLFLLGSGAWLLDVSPKEQDVPGPGPLDRRPHTTAGGRPLAFVGRRSTVLAPNRLV